ncbi:unnamed protein product [Acanthoscelides obtectus]|uniref:Uncharacterized protein n=1 Tax=Acanthoscelides obtectus TaxID=200917 RepID=A0A9P0LQW9_ACAOB|nr:unnamed protein product [Acanthoscelides obtectus]CAK1657377.1 hypothetical protein AOBTE_LOCUS20318 [Acanthoscelides obtectus]
MISLRLIEGDRTVYLGVYQSRKLQVQPVQLIVHHKKIRMAILYPELTSAGDGEVVTAIEHILVCEEGNAILEEVAQIIRKSKPDLNYDKIHHDKNT